VANDVEIEQILHMEGEDTPSKPLFASHVQMRGSVPTYWAQETSVTVPKPPIDLKRIDPKYRATQLHLQDMMARYASPLLVLNLLKQREKREREILIGREFTRSTDYLNTLLPDKHKVRYVALDFTRISKEGEKKNTNVLKCLDEVALWSLKETGFFLSQVGLYPDCIRLSALDIHCDAAPSCRRRRDYSRHLQLDTTRYTRCNGCFLLPASCAAAAAQAVPRLVGHHSGLRGRRGSTVRRGRRRRRRRLCYPADHGGVGGGAGCRRVAGVGAGVGAG
jgi:hypothetical protein